jgi:hypothetical protein
MKDGMNTTISILVCLLFIFISCSGQRADLNYDTKVKDPAFISNHPRILFDEGHNNSHKSSGTYKPFVELIKSDGYKVVVNKGTFNTELLHNYDILVISNAKGKNKKYEPAFTEKECNDVYDWVNGGGSLLLIADHYPFGSAAQNLSEKFGVRMGEGETQDTLNYDKTSTDKAQLIFDDANKLLVESPIKKGRNSDEIVHRVISFTGQSLNAPDTNSIILKLSKYAVDIVPDSVWEKKSMIFFTTTYTRFTDPIPTLGNSQGVALEIGKGRVVILGEAAMLTAQIIEDTKFGMNFPENDNKQFTLNVLHWLSRII